MVCVGGFVLTTGPHAGVSLTAAPDGADPEQTRVLRGALAAANAGTLPCPIPASSRWEFADAAFELTWHEHDFGRARQAALLVFSRQHATERTHVAADQPTAPAQGAWVWKRTVGVGPHQPVR